MNTPSKIKASQINLAQENQSSSAAVANTKTVESRSARKKRLTREKLLNAALNLMSERGYAGVKINEITEEADVGFGSFYNHFESKEALYAELIETLFEAHGDDIEARTQAMTDPALVFATAVRLTLKKAGEDPAWGKLLMKQGLSEDALERGLGQRMLRDLQIGIEQQRFTGSDPFISFLSVAGLVLAALSTKIQLQNPASSQAKLASALQLEMDGLDSRVVKQVLITLGLTKEDASAVSEKSK